MSIALALAGCSATPIGPLNLASPTSALPEVPSVASLLPASARVTGTPTEVYTRVARGALTCWFGAAGPLKGTHIYHAEAAPISQGGQAEIEIFIKDPTAPDPRSQRAYKVLITPGDTKTKVEVENAKIPEPLATRMREDVDRWAADEGGCGEAPTTAGWQAEGVMPQPSAASGQSITPATHATDAKPKPN